MYLRKQKHSGVLIAIAMSFSPSAWAEKPTGCDAKTFAELVLCTDRLSSEIKISEQNLKSTQALEGSATQWINPELDLERVAKGSEKSETTATLFFTFRLGEKKRALQNEFQSDLEKAKALHDETLSQARLQALLSLYRLAHLKSEITIEQESVSTFTKIIAQLQKRPVRSPEQDVSLSIFKMALADHELKVIQLKTDEERIYQRLVASTGISKQMIAKNLPPRKQVWPEVSDSLDANDSPTVRKATAELSWANSQIEKADSEMWPDLKIGPTFRETKENGEATTFVGAGLSLTLPVFNQNKIGRSYAGQKQIESEMNLRQLKVNTAAAHATYVSNYRETVQTLKKTLSSKLVDEKHNQLERQFFKGTVPSALVIEAHRQIFDLEERKNSSELQALESLGQILILNNKFKEALL